MARKLLATVMAAAGLAPASALATEITLDVRPFDILSIAENRRNPGNARAIACGDFNGDGYDDIALGSLRSAALLTDDSGNVLIYFGGPFTPPLSPEKIFFDFTARPDAVSNGLFSTVIQDPGLGAQIFPERGGEQFGYSLAAGDFDGDGIDDLAVGAPAPIAGGTQGALYVIYGRNDLGGIHNIDTEIFNGEAWELRGPVGQTMFAEILFMDDIDLDGYADIAVGCPNGSSQGYGAIVWGRTRTGPTQLSRENFTQIQRMTRLFSNTPGEKFCSSFAAANMFGSAGKELAVGAPSYPNAAQQRGRVVLLNVDQTLPPTIQVDVGTNGIVQYRGTLNGQRIGTSLAFDQFLTTTAQNTLAIGSPGGTGNAGSVFLAVPNEDQATPPGGNQFQIPVTGAARVTFRSSQNDENLGSFVAFAPFDSVPGNDLFIGAPGWTETISGSSVQNGRVYFFNRQSFSAATIDVNDITVQGVTLFGFPTLQRAGTQLAFGNVDGAGRTDLVIGTAGSLTYETFCTSNLLTDWINCNASRRGIRAYMVRAGTIPDSGNPTEVSPAWTMLE